MHCETTNLFILAFADFQVHDLENVLMIDIFYRDAPTVTHSIHSACDNLCWNILENTLAVSFYNSLVWYAMANARIICLQSGSFCAIDSVTACFIGWLNGFVYGTGSWSSETNISFEGVCAALFIMILFLSQHHLHRRYQSKCQRMCRIQSRAIEKASIDV